MADELEAFYAEIANVEAKVEKEDKPPTNDTNAPALPPPRPPPSITDNQQQQQQQPLAPPPRPPTLKPPSIPPPNPIISQPPVIAAPPQPATEQPSIPPPPQQPPQKTTPPPPPKPTPKVGYVREAAGQRWIDPTLAEWPENDFRIFVGNLGPEVTDDVLRHSFNKYESFQKAKVIKEARSGKSKGYGFVSFADSRDGARALREMQGHYIGHRPCQLRKSKADDRNVKDTRGKPKKRLLNNNHHHHQSYYDGGGGGGYNNGGGGDGGQGPARKQSKTTAAGSILHK